MQNFAPEGFKEQGKVLDDYAKKYDVGNVQLSRLLDADYLVTLAVAFPQDRDVSDPPTNAEMRFKARRWIKRTVEDGSIGRNRLPEDVEAAIKARYPDEDGAYKGFKSKK